MKKSYFLYLILVLFLFNCKKDKKTNDIPKPMSKMFFPDAGSSYWKHYYTTPYGDTFTYKYGYDSIFLTQDTIQLNIVSISKPIPTPTTFSILKAVRQGITHGPSQTWKISQVQNYAIIRIDTVNEKIYGVNSEGFYLSSGIYPTTQNFNERIIYDHKLKNNDTAYIKAGYYERSCDVHIDSISYNNTFLYLQYFTLKTSPLDTFSERMQLGCILNSVDYTINALPTYIGRPNAITKKFVFYNNNFDSIIIKRDTQIYP